MFGLPPSLSPGDCILLLIDKIAGYLDVALKAHLSCRGAYIFFHVRILPSSVIDLTENLREKLFFFSLDASFSFKLLLDSPPSPFLPSDGRVSFDHFRGARLYGRG